MFKREKKKESENKPLSKCNYLDVEKTAKSRFQNRKDYAFAAEWTIWPERHWHREFPYHLLGSAGY